MCSASHPYAFGDSSRLVDPVLNYTFGDAGRVSDVSERSHHGFPPSAACFADVGRYGEPPAATLSETAHFGEAPAGAERDKARTMAEAYCADLERVITEAGDESSFFERAAALDRQYSEAWFTTFYGASSGDPMRLYRQAPTGGVVRRAAPAAFGPGSHGGAAGTSAFAAGMSMPASGLGAHAAELMHRHASFLAERAGQPPSAQSLRAPSPASGAPPSAASGLGSGVGPPRGMTTASLFR
eukprot:TRINITY_DN8764_c1_g5_i1.p1 TRINITY_DN8764_c1_g5~~TRINITY_DN8764_c1_g5_i1.p1  ORF type:complete len:241 (+),score=37.15 TRINITY_DN8764_c1_g5_i1:16-738(+)